MNAEEQTHLFKSSLDELEELLKEQIRLVRQGGFNELETVSVRTGRLVEKIVGTGVLESDEFKSRRQHLQNLYESLQLAVSVQKADASEQISHIRKGRKAIGAYRSNI